jgi:hypothetical protein
VAEREEVEVAADGGTVETDVFATHGCRVGLKLRKKCRAYQGTASGVTGEGVTAD